jgi:dynein heavy chain
VNDYSWKRANGDHTVDENQESPIGAPAPRANAAACFWKDKIYIYGGHGGLNYARIAFSDVYSFDINTEVWEKYEPNVS